MKKVSLIGLVSLSLVLTMGLVTPHVQASAPAQAGIVDHLERLADRWTSSDTPLSSPEPEPPVRDPDRVVYLTFDDGPDPRWTPQILQMMQAYDAQGTFFVLGRNVATFPQVIKEMALAGQTFGNHSYNHAHIANYDSASFRAEIADTTDALRYALGDDVELTRLITPCLRPPYGEVSPSFYNNAASMGLYIAFWSIDTEDWKNPDPQSVIQTVIDKTEPHSVILMHDGGEKRENTLKSLALILHELSQRGYSFRPLCTAQGISEAID